MGDLTKVEDRLLLVYYALCVLIGVNVGSCVMGM